MTVGHASQKGRELVQMRMESRDIAYLKASELILQVTRPILFSLTTPAILINSGHSPGPAEYAAISAGMTKPCCLDRQDFSGSMQCDRFLNMPMKVKDTPTEAAPQNAHV